MARKIRSRQPGVVYHLISRFIDARYFMSNMIMRHHYLELMAKALQHTDWQLFAYALMSNHIHLAVLAGRRALARWLRQVHSPFAESVNQVNHRYGPVFVRGPKTYPVANHRVGHLIAYIHNNPVRAGVCDAAAHSAWTSHQAFIGRAPAPNWLNITRALHTAGLASETFDEWVGDPERTVDRSFSQRAHEEELRLARPPMELPQDEVANAIVNAVSIAVGVSTARILGGTRGSSEVMARSAAVHCAGLLGLSEQRIANALNISQQRVSVLRRSPPSKDVREVARSVSDDLHAMCGGV